MKRRSDLKACEAFWPMGFAVNETHQQVREAGALSHDGAKKATLAGQPSMKVFNVPAR